MQDYYSRGALLDRLTHGVNQTGKPVVFLVGSALTAPSAKGEPGIPGVQGVIELILNVFLDQQREDLQQLLAKADNPYQEAFHFLVGRRGPQVANGIIRAAIAQARKQTQSVNSTAHYALNMETTDEACRLFDSDKTGWSLTPAVKSLGELAVKYPSRFGRTILTTNFDPLIGAAAAIAGGTSFRTVLHRDGNLQQTDGEGLHVVHLHGYWYGSDTLHTTRQLNQSRPNLKSSLSHLLRDKIVVVMGYGGWDDVFMDALVEVVVDDNAYPEVIWTFNDAQSNVPTRLLQRLEPGLARGRVSLYDGVDCHTFIPDLVSAWQMLESPSVSETIQESELFILKKHEHQLPLRRRSPKWINKEEDSPPTIDFYVGRAAYFDALSGDDYKIAYVTGMGGQGKSALAAKYFEEASSKKAFAYRLWRDCREVSEKFEDQIASIVEGLGNGKATSTEISNQSIEDIADVFCALTTDIPLLIIFDNVDHYVDLDTDMLGGALGRFIDRFLQRESVARLIFTCRPKISHPRNEVLSLRLTGLQLQDVNELLDFRGAKLDKNTVSEVHTHTAGHAFWVDLLAAQIARKRIDAAQLRKLLSSIVTDNFGIPDNTLNSIWDGLPEREKIVLQVLAEVIRPTTDLELSDYLGSRVRFNQMTKALKTLRDLNLVVVKLLEGGIEGLELHPLIKTFIRQTFPTTTRKSFIGAIFAVYTAFFGTHRKELARRPSKTILVRWLEGAELCVNSGDYEQASIVLSDIAPLYSSTEPPGEFVRVVEMLFNGAGIKGLRKHSEFEKIFGCYIRLVSRMGRIENASEALSEYLETLDAKDARYIHYCDMMAHLHWTNGNYPTAIKWGTDGLKLKTESGVDTHYSTEHTLALAQRDSGAIDSALTTFLKGSTLENVIDPESIEAERGGEFYGNIGRCLQLMGQIEPALICYKKSAKLIEGTSSHLDNQAFIRLWIGELLISQEDRNGAKCFLVASMEKWKDVSPPRFESLASFIGKTFPDEVGVLHPSDAEEYCQKWIFLPHASSLKLTISN